MTTSFKSKVLVRRRPINSNIHSFAPQEQASVERELRRLIQAIRTYLGVVDQR
jgi:hypothetical protein